ncbi:hypothetical protein ACT3CE_13745 [Marinifilum sp. RC60d5]|uniref:hypothetical protein n=1 Tax=Marinifilum sp. RC60d5 TaxID=3458414 RepID=UPI0040363F05
MIQSKDFIERLLEDLSRGVAKIVQMKECGQYVQAMEQVNEAYNTYFEDIDLELEQSEQKLQAYAILLKEEGEILLAENKKYEAKDVFLKACRFLAKADVVSTNYDLGRFSLHSEINILLERCPE